MGSINQCFQFVGSSETGRSGEETGYMIPETSIIGMFLDCHNLNTVVSFLSDAWKCFFAEFVISSDLFLLLCHSDMTLVYQQRIGGRLKCFLLEFIGFFRCPYLCTEYLGLFILNDACSPGRDTLTLTTIPIYIQLIQVSMMNGICRQVDLPNPIL